MRSGFRIGKIFGINIQIDWSWLFIFFLISWNLAVVFGQYHPNWAGGFTWGMALIAALLFFVSVLAHELAHSVMAKAQGVSVRSITLFLFGGVSNIQRHPPSPQAEFLITIVGPITSFVLGALFILLSGVSGGAANVANPTDMIAQLNPAATIFIWLGSINILLAIFNLIPGFPLDGGRVLRSILWAITENLRRATRWASWVGQLVAWLFIVAGISMIFGVRIPFFGTGFINGLWLAFIGWFLNSASVQSYQQILVQDILEDVPVKRLMRSNPPTVLANSSVGDLVHEHIMGTDERAFPVLEEGRLIGLVTLEDVRKIKPNAWDTTTVGEIMTPSDDLIIVDVEEDAAEALNKLRQRDVRQLPVMHNGQLDGLLRRRDIIRWLQLQDEPAMG